MNHRYSFCAVLLLSTVFVSAKQPTSEIDKQLTIYIDVMRQLDMNYADTLNYADLVATSVNQMLRKVDPYTVYIPEDKTNDLRFMTTGKYGGIGAVIMQRNETDSTTNKRKDKAELAVYISNPYENMPAALADVRAGDKILEVDGKNALGKTTTEVSQMLRGTPGSTITLKLQREGEVKPIVRTFQRQEIKINPVSYAAVLPLDSAAESVVETSLHRQAAYIAFTEFTEGSARIFTDTLNHLVAQGASALVLDLRDNVGGIIDEAVKMLSLFVPRGTEVVTTKGQTKASERVYRTPLEPTYAEMPIMVLVNSHSASAAEIVSGALQDLDRATLIGTRTYGKGLVQSIRPIAHGGHLKITTAKYYIPSGRCIQAIDYSKRRADGSVERVPDSLTHTFKTRLGRIVRDGGGIEPDIVMEDSSKVDICYSLYVQNMFFDYATRYRVQHAQIASAQNFAVSDAELEDFIAFLHEKHFTYTTETSKYFADVLEMAHHEDLDSAVIAQLEALQQQITPTAEVAIERREKEVKEMLGREIVLRYYYDRGATAFGLREDKELQRALQELRAK